jgi:hypothetical protein
LVNAIFAKFARLSQKRPSNRAGNRSDHFDRRKQKFGNRFPALSGF